MIIIVTSIHRIYHKLYWYSAAKTKILYLCFHNCRGPSIENFEKAQKDNSS